MRALEALAEVHAEHGHLQEVILQNFVPHPRYYGAEPAEIADEAQRTGDARRGGCRCRPGRTTVTLDDMRALVRESRAADARRRHPDPAEPVRLVAAAGRGGRDRPRRAVRQRRPHLARAPVPVVAPDAQAARAARLRAHRAALRLPAVHGPGLDRAGRARRDQAAYWSFIPRRGSGRREERAIRRDLVPGAIARARDGVALGEEELTALFAETRPEAIEDMRQAADELRAELAGETVTFVVNRNINVSNVCTVGCAFCGFGQGKRSPDAYEHDRDGVRAARARRRSSSAPPRSACSRASTPTGGSRTTSAGCGWPRRPRPQHPPARLLADGGRRDVRRSGLAPREVFERLRAAGLDSTPGTAAEVLHDGVRERISPNKLPVGALGRGHRGLARRRPALDGDGDVRPHRGAVGAGRAHARGARAAGAHRRLHRVRAAVVHPVPHAARAARTGSRRSRREENLKHTAVFRLALGRTIPSLQASWVKMGLDAATEALRWGVNDLGGTLMEESISRLAGSLARREARPEDLIAAAHAAGRPAAERDTLYGIRRRYELPLAA